MRHIYLRLNLRYMTSINALKPYIQIARPDHWVKHVFILPGIFLGLALAPTFPKDQFIYNIALGMISAVFIASANYVINEWLDAEFDAFHPEKNRRPAPMGLLKARWIYLEYFLLLILGLAFALFVSNYFVSLAIVFAISGVVYNVKPIRSKDIPYIDVITESFNNPLRLAMGWVMVSNSFPPLSLLVSYWAVGAFLMAVKRLSEFNEICMSRGEATACLYRNSFRFYNVQSLITSCFVYALISIFGITVFIVKYRSEFVLTAPFFIIMFSYYLSKGMKPNSIAQKPEALYKDKILMTISVLLLTIISVCAFFDMPIVEYLLKSKFIYLQ